MSAGTAAIQTTGAKSFCGSYGMLFNKCGDTTSGDGDDINSV